MVDIYFGAINVKQFDEQFADESACLSYLADLKWAEGYKCRKCGHERFCRGRKPFSRRCTRCKTEESATAHTTFHRCRIYLPYAFKIAWYCCFNPSITTKELSDEFNIRQMTCWKFKKKILNCLDNREKVKNDLLQIIE